MWTVDTLDAEQDPRRRHEPDTVFFVCGFNTMGEFRVGSEGFFSSPSSCQGCSERSKRQGGVWGGNLARYLSVCDVLEGGFSCGSGGEKAAGMNYPMCPLRTSFDRWTSA